MARRPKKSKRVRALQSHARRRAYERFGILMDDELRQEIVQAIQAGRSLPVERQTNRVSVHDVKVNDETVRVVYDRHRKEIITFLHPDLRYER